MADRGPEWLRWVDDLAGITHRHLEQWELRPEGAASHGSRSLVLPVRTSAGRPTVLKISFPDPGSEHEHLVLRRWDGNGAVRLLRADPHHSVVLLERLRRQTLDTLPDVDACEVVAGMYRRIHVPELPQLRSLTSYVERWTHDFQALPRGAPIPHRLVEQAIALSRDLIADSAATGSVLHGDLHYGSVADQVRGSRQGRAGLSAGLRALPLPIGHTVRSSWRDSVDSRQVTSGERLTFEVMTGTR
jgi:streptomycin 6-kinase